jgi:hypothetical protein
MSFDIEVVPMRVLSFQPSRVSVSICTESGIEIAIMISKFYTGYDKYKRREDCKIGIMSILRILSL